MYMYMHMWTRHDSARVSVGVGPISENPVYQLHSYTYHYEHG
jgi:hypothetical protein